MHDSTWRVPFIEEGLAMDPSCFGLLPLVLVSLFVWFWTFFLSFSLKILYCCCQSNQLIENDISTINKYLIVSSAAAF